MLARALSHIFALTAGPETVLRVSFQITHVGRLASILVLINWQYIKQAENMPPFHRFQHFLISTVSLLYLASCCLSQDMNFIVLETSIYQSDLTAADPLLRLKTPRKRIAGNWESRPNSGSQKHNFRRKAGQDLTDAIGNQERYLL